MLLALSVLFIFSCGAESSPDEPDVLEPPHLVSSIPADGAAEVDTKTTAMQLVFESNLIVVSESKFHLNNNVVSTVTAEENVLTVTFSTLQPETEYTLLIDALALKVVNGAVNSAQISISFTTAAGQAVDITNKLAVDNPSPEATNLYSFLKENYGEKIISSAMANVNWNINEAEWVKQHTGKYPAIATFDYVHLPYSPADWVDYSDISVVEDWWNNNGIISAGWHWIVPTYEGSADDTYKPEETTFKALNVTIDGTWENAAAKADLEEIVGYLKLLQAKNIPVIWRPLHEAAGNTYEYTNGEAWFWWGTDGADTYKELWVFMFDYFKAQGLNNLIWVWTTQTKDNAFYPGDNYVDIVGRDIYNNAEAASIADEFNTIQQTYPTKMITLSECGNTADVSEQWNAGAKWSYFMPWYDYERTNDTNESDFAGTDHEHANAAWWTNAFSNTYVITRDQMPDLK
ncbi:beta-mannosidase [Labilibaculum manganireducens]|uniref:Beta-mannosidase n=2 Tax=Labilibaculum manganireducens TaxID=1940525 RepID=A0A2N3IH03_9BACT|nr:beta-mannosidase [Labilibaculum manganireducens]